MANKRIETVAYRTLLYHQVSLDDTLSMMSRARKILSEIGVAIPVTTAEIWPLLAGGAGPIIAQASDFICMQIQPFWEGRPVDCGDTEDCVGAAQYVVDKAAEIEALLGKRVVICETGWPTAGEKCCDVRPYALQGFQVCYFSMLNPYCLLLSSALKS